MKVGQKGQKGQEVKGYYQEKQNVQEGRKEQVVLTFAGMTGMLQLGYGVIIVLCIILSRDLDSNDPQLGYLHLDFFMKLPFEVMLLFLAVITLVASHCIFQGNSIEVRYYSALIGMLSSFATGTYLAIQVCEYTPIVRSFPQNIKILILLKPFYLSLQVGAAVSLLGTFPMMAFSFYTLYCKSEGKTGLEGNAKEDGNDGKDVKEEGWRLGVFLANCAVQVVCIVQLYQYSESMDAADYAWQNAVDIYTFSLTAAVIVETVALTLQFMHRKEPFLNKKEKVVLAVLVALFQSATLVLLILKTVESFLQLFLMEDELCNKEDCIFASAMQGKFLTYALFNLLCISVQSVYLKQLSPQWPTTPAQGETLTSESVSA